MITSLGKGFLAAVLLLPLQGAAWHCDHHVRERKFGCCLIVVTGGFCMAFDHFVGERRSDCCLIVVTSLVPSGIVIT